MRENTESVLSYWFGDEQDDAAVVESQSSLWWDKHPGVDAEIRARFQDLRTDAISGFLQSWAHTPRSRLALIILVDCFSRNIFRDSRLAFEHDAMACAWCREGITQGHDRILRIIERLFFYMPLQRSEHVEDQDLAVAMYSNLVMDAAPEHRERLSNYTADVHKQREVIARFGRFPYRNALMGRRSTDEELDFMTRAVRYV